MAKNSVEAEALFVEMEIQVVVKIDIQFRTVLSFIFMLISIAILRLAFK